MLVSGQNKLQKFSDLTDVHEARAVNSLYRRSVIPIQSCSMFTRFYNKRGLKPNAKLSHVSLNSMNGRNMFCVCDFVVRIVILVCSSSNIFTRAIIVVTVFESVTI